MASERFESGMVDDGIAAVQFNRAGHA